MHEEVRISREKKEVGEELIDVKVGCALGGGGFDFSP